MSIPDILGSPWAITKGKMDEILTVWDRHLAGEKASAEILEPYRLAMQTSGNEKAAQKPYAVTPEGVAVIAVDGVIAKKMNLFSAMSGGTSTEMLGAKIDAALADPEVKALLLDINSPGGTVGGVDALSEKIFAARDRKPIVAYADGQMTSAAYWIGSAATTIVAAKGAMVGSIGVLIVHTDYSAQDAQRGVKRTYLTAGKYKALGNDAEPLSEFARATLQEILDDAYSQFVDAVAQYRDVAVDTVLADMADGRIFTGPKALKAGLVDSLGTQKTALEKAVMLATGGLTRQGITLKIHKEATMDTFKTLAELVAAYPEFAAELRAEGVRSVDLAAASKTAVASERDRILGLAAIQFGEAGGKFKTIVESGVTTEQLTAIRALNPEQPAAQADQAAGKEQQTKEQLLAALAQSGAPQVGADSTTHQGGKDYMTLVEEYMAANKCSKLVAMQAVTAAHPDVHREFIKKANEGRR